MSLPTLRGRRFIIRESHAEHLTLSCQENLLPILYWDNGSAVTMFEFSEGSLIGANLLFGDHHIYPLNIYTTSPCELLHISSGAVLELLHGYSFTLSFVKALSQNSQGINNKLAMYTQKTLREKHTRLSETAVDYSEIHRDRPPCQQERACRPAGCTAPFVIQRI